MRASANYLNLKIICDNIPANITVTSKLFDQTIAWSTATAKMASSHQIIWQTIWQTLSAIIISSAVCSSRSGRSAVGLDSSGQRARRRPS